jgi:hypothetical protein
LSTSAADWRAAVRLLDVGMRLVAFFWAIGLDL